MESRNKILVLLTINIIIITISVISIIKVYNNHINNLYLVVENKIEESAKKCFLEDNCEGKETTLNNLIALNYIEKQINPISKEYVNGDLKITFDGDNCHTTIR